MNVAKLDRIEAPATRIVHVHGSTCDANQRILGVLFVQGGSGIKLARTVTASDGTFTLRFVTESLPKPQCAGGAYRYGHFHVGGSGTQYPIT